MGFLKWVFFLGGFFFSLKISQFWAKGAGRGIWGGKGKFWRGGGEKLGFLKGKKGKTAPKNGGKWGFWGLGNKRE